ncbi:unnamed protein product, partial [Rotaria sp. Silwood2]
ILVQQVSDYERDSIDKIRQTADEARQLLLKHTAKHIPDIEIKLNKLTDQLRQSRQENDFIETDLHQWKNQFIQLTDELNKLSNITIKQDLEILVNKIYVDISTMSPCKIKINDNTRWLQDGITITGGNQRGNELSQLDGPWGICVDDDEQTIYIADTFNHRIIEWKYGATHGQVMAGGNGPGKRIDQLYEPTDLAVDKEKDCFIICDRGNRRVVRWPRRNGTCGQTVISDVQCYGLTKDHDKYFYIADHERHEIRRWRIGDTCETVVAGGHGEGNRLDQLDSPGYIFVDKDYSVYISDEKNHRVMKWIKGATEGIVVAGGQGKGNGLAQLSGPREVLADQLGTVYVTDCGNHRVMLWSKGAT